MQKWWVFGLAVLIFLSCQNRDERAEVSRLMAEQVTAWNSADLDGFMSHYWQDDSLMFIGSGGLHYGWKALYERYTKSYDEQNQMGKLRFEILNMQQLSTDNILVVGTWHVQNDSGLHEGPFSLNWKKSSDGWKIFCDHTGTFETDH